MLASLRLCLFLMAIPIRAHPSIHPPVAPPFLSVWLCQRHRGGSAGGWLHGRHIHPRAHRWTASISPAASTLIPPMPSAQPPPRVGLAPYRPPPGQGSCVHGLFSRRGQGRSHSGRFGQTADLGTSYRLLRPPSPLPLPFCLISAFRKKALDLASCHWIRLPSPALACLVICNVIGRSWVAATLTLFLRMPTWTWPCTLRRLAGTTSTLSLPLIDSLLNRLPVRPPSPLPPAGYSTAASHALVLSVLSSPLQSTMHS